MGENSIHYSFASLKAILDADHLSAEEKEQAIGEIDKATRIALADVAKAHVVAEEDLGALMRKNEGVTKKVNQELKALEGVMDKEKAAIATASQAEVAGLRTQMNEIDNKIKELTRILHEEWSSMEGEMSEAQRNRLAALNGVRSNKDTSE